MFWILTGVLEEDDNEDWVIGVVNRMVCADFEMLEEVIGVVNWVMYAGFEVLEGVIGVVNQVVCCHTWFSILLAKSNNFLLFT